MSCSTNTSIIHVSHSIDVYFSYFCIEEKFCNNASQPDHNNRLLACSSNEVAVSFDPSLENSCASSVCCFNIPKDGEADIRDSFCSK